MITINEVEIADNLVFSIALRTERLATHVARYLAGFQNNNQVTPCRSCPTGFVLELMAILQLRIWENQGLDLSRLDLPTSEEAGQNMSERIARDPSSFRGGNGSPLFFLIFHAWCQKLLWISPWTENTEVIVGDTGFCEETMTDLIQRLLRD